MANPSGRGPGLDFEAPILDLELKIRELEALAASQQMALGPEIRRLKDRAAKLSADIFATLTPWQRTQVARHPQRPQAIDFVRALGTDIIELHGDRHFRDDRALATGLARFDGQRALFIANRKGRDTRERLAANFGMPHPEGYRKVLNKMRLAAKFRLPVLVFIDTPGAYPGIGAEERGQAQAIAENLREMSRLPVPILIVVTGEGFSGGALAVGVGDRMALLENAVFSVISPEGCAAILWKDAAKASQAAGVLKLTAKDLQGLGLIDDIIPEPPGGAHRDPRTAFDHVRAYLLRTLGALTTLPIDRLRQERYERYRRLGECREGKPAAGASVSSAPRL
jgi:acetyl-CoA carboxylase carboxyl transferase subunit alpha